MDELEKFREELRTHDLAKYPAQAKVFIIGLLVVVFVGIAGFAYMKHVQHQEAVVMTQAQMQSANALQNKLHVSEANAKALQEYAAKAETGKVQPVANYYVTAPTVQTATEIVKKHIDLKDTTLPPAAIANSDRTAVVPNVQQQKVDVYKVNLDKPRGVGVYASTSSAGAILQYNRVLAFGGQKFTGGYDVGVGYMIRF